MLVLYLYTYIVFPYITLGLGETREQEFFYFIDWLNKFSHLNTFLGLSALQTTVVSGCI